MISDIAIVCPDVARGAAASLLSTTAEGS